MKDDTPNRLPWRASVADWPSVWRERWGRLAGDLEAKGAIWPESERLAFVEVAAAKRGEPTH